MKQGINAKNPDKSGGDNPDAASRNKGGVGSGESSESGGSVEVLDIGSGAKIVDLGLIVDGDTLVVADSHIGYEEALNKEGVLIPRFQLDDIKARVDGMARAARPKTIVINGDVKHEFGTISETEWRDTLDLIDFLAERCERLVLVKGNHDKILGPIARKRNIEVVGSYETKSALITHGDVLAETEKKTVVIGHQHPAVSLREGARVEVYKCFLICKHGSKRVIVLPSLNLVTEGTDVLQGEILSPYLEGCLEECEVVVAGPKPLRFGMVKDILRSTG